MGPFLKPRALNQFLLNDQQCTRNCDETPREKWHDQWLKYVRKIMYHTEKRQFSVVNVMHKSRCEILFYLIVILIRKNWKKKFNCFTFPWVSMTSENKITNSFDWSFSISAFLLIECSMRLISLVSEIANQHVPTSRAVKQEIAENSKPHMMYSTMTAVKYPSGLVVSNGNLLNGRMNMKHSKSLMELFTKRNEIYHIGNGNWNASLPVSVKR